MVGFWTWCTSMLCCSLFSRRIIETPQAWKHGWDVLVIFCSGFIFLWGSSICQSILVNTKNKCQPSLQAIVLVHWEMTWLCCLTFPTRHCIAHLSGCSPFSCWWNFFWQMRIAVIPGLMCLSPGTWQQNIHNTWVLPLYWHHTRNHAQQTSPTCKSFQTWERL